MPTGMVFMRADYPVMRIWVENDQNPYSECKADTFPYISAFNECCPLLKQWQAVTKCVFRMSRTPDPFPRGIILAPLVWNQ